MEDKEKYKALKQYALAHSGEHSIRERARKILLFIDNQILNR
jgi:hypothetical protein